MENDTSERLLLREFKRMIDGTVRPEVRLELLQAVKKRKEHSEQLRKKWKTYQNVLNKKGPLAKYEIVQAGGDPENGKTIFRQHNSAQCIRCHNTEKQEGEKVKKAGPNLAGIGKRKNAEELVRALVRPGASIADGFEMVTLRMKNGKVLTGTVRSVGEGKVQITPPAGEPRIVQKNNIQSRESDSTSSMPPMGSVLTMEELRDVIAYLKRLK